MSAPPTCPSSPAAMSIKDSISPCLSDTQPQVNCDDSAIHNTKLPEWEQW